MSTPDHFVALGLPRTLALEAEQLETVYRDLAKQHHPDTGGDEGMFGAINTAYATLRSPAKRARHLQELLAIPNPKGGAPMADDLMDLFSRLGPALAQAADVAKKKQAARSDLARALLAEEEMTAIKALQALGGQLQEAIDSTEATFQELPGAELPATAARLSFLEKWQAQLRECFAALA